MGGGQTAGLADLGIQADIGHELGRRREPGEVTDGRRRYSHIDARDGHQPAISTSSRATRDSSASTRPSSPPVKSNWRSSDATI